LPSCKFCNKPLLWKQPYKKGDRPVEKNGKPHNCPKYQPKGGDNDNKSYGKYKMATVNDIVRCPYCKGTNYGYCSKEDNELEYHIKSHHPNQEILYDDDFMAINKDKEPKTFKVHRPCYKCGVYLMMDLGDAVGKTTFLCQTCS
jgi:hypothetical protein